MTLTDLLRAAQERLATKVAERKAAQDNLVSLRSAVEAGDESITEDTVRAAISRRDALDVEVDAAQARVTELEAEVERDAVIDALANVRVDTGAPKPRYDEVARVGTEERTYRPDTDPTGGDFLRDVASSITGNFAAAQRLDRHMAEERVERGQYLKRAAGTGAFAGLVVPQYLTDLYAPAAKALRPFADICNKHPLPADGMTVNISRITTATSTAIQTENNAVSETNIDDTLLSPAVQTIGGQQTVSRQALERGTGIEGVVLDDLFRSYATTLDSTLINQATNGLTNVAGSSVTYTDTDPTAAELHPKILGAQAVAEAALLGQGTPDYAVMHSRRWNWLLSQLSTSNALFGFPNLPPGLVGSSTGAGYDAGVRGYLPSGLKVIVDNNIATNLGTGTNEDEIYIVTSSECHLWEDSAAPMFIRAEQTAAASLGVLMVVYGYFAYTFARYTGGQQKISGTGLVTPTF